jgi:predicted nuclease with TOPRIM domain
MTTSDLVKRLRTWTSRSAAENDADALEAADRIEELEADVAWLKGLLDGAEKDACDWIDEKTKRLQAENKRLQEKVAELETELDLLKHGGGFGI